MEGLIVEVGTESVIIIFMLGWLGYLLAKILVELREKL